MRRDEINNGLNDEILEVFERYATKEKMIKKFAVRFDNKTDKVVGVTVDWHYFKKSNPQ